MTTRHRLPCETKRTTAWSSVLPYLDLDLPDSAGDLRDMGSFPGSGRSPGGGNGNPLQSSFFIYIFILIISSLGCTRTQLWRTGAPTRCSVWVL